MPEMTNEAMIYLPTIRERFWRKMGFRYHCGDEPEGTEKMAGWIMTTARFDFSLLDRFRLLVSGRLFIRITQHTDIPVNTSINRVDYEIREPF